MAFTIHSSECDPRAASKQLAALRQKNPFVSTLILRPQGCGRAFRRVRFSSRPCYSVHTKAGVLRLSTTIRSTAMRFTLLPICLALLSVGVSAETYRWVDSSGQAHIGDTLPSGNVKNLRATSRDNDRQSSNSKGTTPTPT
ncbi:MAG: DUF4124 domain-containing protein, partial [Desulfobulbus sp.]|nr:DUF4124 domain-containing protein [Desulfobulbus sp.]